MIPTMPNKLYYLIGENIGTSLSPKIHNFLFRKKGLENLCSYSLYSQQKIPTNLLSKQLNDGKIGGYSITIPYKKYFSENNLVGFDKIVKEIRGEFALKRGIINTLIFDNSSSSYIGYNTDFWAIQKLLTPQLGRMHQNYNMNNNIIILGAGATAQTFCYFMNQSKFCNAIYIYNRTQQKIKALKQTYSKVLMNKNKQQSKQSVHFIINTLPTNILQQKSQQIHQYLSSFQLDLELVFMDVNYRDKSQISSQIINNLINNHHKHKNIQIKHTLITGLDMLIYQAIEQNRLFLEPIEKLLPFTKKYTENAIFQMIKSELF